MDIRVESPAVRPTPVALLLDVPVRSSDELFAFAADRMAFRATRVAEDFARRLAARHARLSTAIGGGVALPHADSGRAARTHALYLRTTAGIEFGAPDGLPVTDFLFLLVPRPASAAQTALLTQLRYRLALPEVVRALRTGPTEDLLAALWHEATAG